jgi:hypothetical protein
MARIRGICQAALACLPALFAPCASAQEFTGRLAGDIKLISVYPALAVHLNGVAIRDGPAAVRLFRAGASTPSATTAYVIEPSPALVSGEWKAGSYTANPQVDSAGTAFAIEAWLSLDGQGQYRLGNALGAPGAFRSEPVLPVANDPAGKTLHLAECAALAKVTVRLGGDSAAMAALGEPGASCHVSASVEEFADSGHFNFQARSPAVAIAAADLKSPAGTTIAFPVRASGRVKFLASCEMRPVQPGFLVDDEGNAVFAHEGPPQQVACNGADAIAALELPVQLFAGAIHGKLDVQGLTETGAGVAYNAGGNVRTYLVPPAQLPQPPFNWSMAGVQPGTAVVTAFAAFDNNTGMRLPRAMATVLAGAPPYDLGGTFVVRPLLTAGRLFLIDPQNRAGLTTPNTIPVGPGGGTNASFMQATGDDRTLAQTMADPPLGDATGAESYGGFSGDYSATRNCSTPDLPPGCAELSYRLPMSGRSADKSVTDGSRTQATMWHIDGFQLVFGAFTSDRYQKSIHRLESALTYVVAPSSLAHALALPPVQPDLAMCVGRVEVDLRVDAATGALFAPRLFATSVSMGDVPLIVNPRLVKSSTHTSHGTPATRASAASAASAFAVVPEGAAYDARVTVDFAPPAGGPSTSIASLPPFRLPAEGALGCGQTVRGCLKINDPGGSATPLSVNIGAQSACTTASSVSLPVSVRSSQVEVESISYAVDGHPAATLVCSPCGADPVRQIGPLDLGPGSHTITVTAVSSNGCSASTSYSFLKAQPVLACPAAITAYLAEGENAIPAADPRIAGSLNATVSGGCPGAEVADDRPSAFPAGLTTVRFSLEGAASCTTAVRVTKNQEIAFFDGDLLKMHRARDGGLVYAVTPSGGAGPIRFSFQGRRLAIRSPTRVTTLDAATGAQVRVEPGRFADFEFRPGSVSDRAFVVQPTAAGAPYALRVALGTTTSEPLVPGTGAANAPPRLAWERERISVAFTQPAGANTRLSVRQWPVVGATLGTSSVRAVQLPGAQQLRAIAPAIDGGFVFATNAGVFRLLSDWTLAPLFPIPVNDVDLHLRSLFGIDPNVPGGSALVLGPGVFMREPIPGELFGLAVSGADNVQETILAVARSNPPRAEGQPRALHLYRPGDPLVLHRVIEAQNPRYPAFKPR